MAEWPPDPASVATPVEGSVVIPVLNMAELLDDQLRALDNQVTDRRFEIIVVDNGSSDGVASVVERWKAHMRDLRLVDAPQRGINHARNAGGRAATSDALLFCDADDVVEGAWVESMIRALGTAEAAGGRIRLYDRDADAWGEPSTPGRLTTTELPRSPLGACCAVRRGVWEDLGEFDEALTGGAGDETEFFWRLQSAGFRLVIAPDAIVRYRMPDEERVLRKKEYRAARERVRLLRRFGLAVPPRQWAALEFRAWGALVKDAPRALMVSARRPAYLRKVSKAFGRMAGTLLYRNEPQRFVVPPTQPPT